MMIDSDKVFLVLLDLGGVKTITAIAHPPQPTPRVYNLQLG